MFKTRFISMLVLLAAVATGAVAQSYNVTVKDGTEDADKWSATPNPATAGQTVTIKYNGTKTVKSIKAVKKVSTLATALENGATVTVDYNWNNSNHTYFNFTNNNGTYTCSISGDEPSDFGGSLTMSGNTLVFAATNKEMPGAINVTINFDTTYNTYQITQRGRYYVGFAISVNGTDITSQLTAQDADEVAVIKTANNNEWTLTMPASDVELQVEYYATTPFDLTVGENEHGTVTFTVGGETTDKACYDDVVTVSVTPNEGYSAKDVTVRAYTSWEAASEILAGGGDNPSLVSDINVTKQQNGTWTFTMPEANVWVVVTYTKNLQDAWIQAIADQTYTGSAITPTVTVMDGETTLVLNSDYTVAYSNNVNTSTATVTVTGMGNYSGTATANFTILADKTALNTAITEAETYYNSIKDDHTEAAAALKTAIDTAKAMQEKGDATQEEVNNALSALTTAKTTAEGAVLADTKNELNNDITAAETYYNSIKDDHADAANTLKDAIDAAKGVKDNAGATQAEVEAAIAALASAKTTAEQTVLTETKTALNDDITEAEAYYNGIKDDHATAAATLLDAINAAKTVKDNADATQEQVEAAIAALSTAINTAKVEVSRVTLTIPAKSYMARIDADKRQIETAVAGVKLYSVQNVTNTEVVLTAELSVIAAEMPYFIYNDNDTEVEVSIIVSSEDADNVDYDSEHFKGTLVDKTFTDEDMEEYDHYVLNGGSSFVWVKDAGTLAAGKCWVQLEKSPANARALSIVFEGETTGISTAKTAADTKGAAVYDLQGRRVMQPTKGLFIVNGKKVVIK
jgi:hypothetical protein